MLTQVISVTVFHFAKPLPSFQTDYWEVGCWGHRCKAHIIIMAFLAHCWYLQVRQWAEIQAHSRKIPLEGFLALAEQKRQEIRARLEVSTAWKWYVTAYLGLQQATGWTARPSSSFNANVSDLFRHVTALLLELLVSLYCIVFGHVSGGHVSGVHVSGGHVSGCHVSGGHVSGGHATLIGLTELSAVVLRQASV